MSANVAENPKDSASERDREDRPVTDPSRTVDKTPGDQGESREHQEDLLDEALEETFPGSDPISPKQIT